MAKMTVVWRDALEARKWWGRVMDYNGRCLWIQGNFDSAKQAERAAKEAAAQCDK